MNNKPMPPPVATKHVINTGVMALARETGLSAQAISMRMKRGQTAEQIRDAVAQRKGQTRSHGQEKKALGKHEYSLVLKGRERIDAMDDAKLRRAQAQAERQELENMLRRGELIPVAYVRQWATQFLTDARDTMMAGPSELQDGLAIETDPVKCAALLRAWLERVMGKFHQLERLWGVSDQEQVA